MIKDFARRPSSRLIAYSLTFGVLGVGMPSAEAAGRVDRPAAARRAVQPVAATRDAATGIVEVFVQMQAQPAMLAYAEARDAAKAAAGTDAALDRNVGVSAGRIQAQKARAEQARALPSIQALGAKVIYQAHRAVNGIAVRVDARQIPALRALPGVKGVHVMTPKEIDNSSSVPFLNIPAGVWDATTGAGVTGQGVKVGIIDTGIDYQHANFGGTGLLVDYQANDRTAAPDAYYPTAKVVGGRDFAGDNYSAGVTSPVPDDDPMDCNGHGTHVAGTAAGLGVNADGTTFAGPYDGTATAAALSPLRIGPGTAPGAELYALRVFGCKGSTNLTAEAIDWAMDPDGDDDFSDHLDVINMSLGSNFGSIFDESTEASNAAAAAGVIVVTSAGNAGDVYFVTGAPGSASGAVAVAASTDALLSVRTTLAGPAAVMAAGAANFGQQVSAVPVPDPDSDPNTKVALVLAQDGSGASQTDGCCGTVSPWKCAAPNTWTNAADIAGKIAVVDRGTCEFAMKAYNAQINGAIGVIIANNTTGTIQMGVSAAAPEINAQITVPTAMVSQADGGTLKANIATTLADMATSGALGNTLASFSSRGPRRAWGLKPDVAAPGASITSSQTGVVCTSDPTGTQCAAPFDPSGFSAGSKALTIGGTSMAAPHVAGIMATLKQLHPTWTPRQLRALVISTSSGDIFTAVNSAGAKYGPGRVGAGLVNPPAAASSDVVMGYGPDYNGLSWSDGTDTFGTEISKAYTATKTVTVLNKGTGSHSYTASYVASVDNPGIAVSFPGGTAVNLGPKKTVNLKVNVASTGPDSVSKTKDPSVASTQTTTLFGGAWSREWQGEESGYIVLTPSGDEPALRLPFHIAPRPTANLLAKKFASPLVLSGTGFVNINPALTGFGAEIPITSFLEWQATSPNEVGSGDPQTERLLDSADIHEVGVGSDFAAGGGELFFGISTWGNWSSPNEVEFRVFVDSDLNGTPDFFVFNSDTQRSLQITFGNTAWNDSPVTSFCNMLGNCIVFDDFLNGLAPNVVSTQLFNNNVMVLPFFPGDLAFLSVPPPPVNGRFNYWVEAYNREGGFVDAVGSAGSPLTYDPTAPGIEFNLAGGFTGTPWYGGDAGVEVPFTFDATAYQANGSLGVLALHHHNAGPTKTAAGTRSEALAVNNWVSVSDASEVEGNAGSKTLSFNVTLNAPAATAVVVKLETADDSATVADADYTAKAGSVTIPAGLTSKVFTVKIKGDTKGCGAGDDGNEQFFVNITSASGAAVDDAQGVGTIQTDDTVCPTP